MANDNAPDDTMHAEGGKVLHLKLLNEGGFNVLPTLQLNDIQSIPEGRRFIVRSSAEHEDGMTTTGAGQNVSLRDVDRADLPSAIQTVLGKYDRGSAPIQVDVTEEMKFSGVVYTNLGGDMHMALSRNSGVHGIVENEHAETEVTVSPKGTRIKGSPIDPRIIREIASAAANIEDYFGRPMDTEVAYLEENGTPLERIGVKEGLLFLQARPLPNPSPSALQEHEMRRVRKLLAHHKDLGLEEIILGVGNYREINENDKATELSITTFNYVFVGDGKEKFGGVQLGRNEIGYDLGHEAFPWVVMVGGKVYYNFSGDALHFRPQGISLENMMEFVNGVLIPQVRGNPELLNYSELGLYVQFPEQAESVGLESEPFHRLAERNRENIKSIVPPEKPPKRHIAKEYDNARELLEEIQRATDNIRTGSAKQYVQAARFGFFALENTRVHLLQIQREEPEAYESLSTLFQRKDAAELRDQIVYDESIESFTPPRTEEYKYLGSFEITGARGYAAERHYKKGKMIDHESLANTVGQTRKALENREKVKFTLFRDYEYLRQLYDQFATITGFGSDLYHLQVDELQLAIDNPILATYRVDLRKRLRGENLFDDPIFESDVYDRKLRQEKKPKLLFGSVGESLDIVIGENAVIIDAVDQTVSIPNSTQAVFVPDNIRPGSHLFTLLSDYGIPVIGLPPKDRQQIEQQPVTLRREGDNVTIDYHQA